MAFCKASAKFKTHSLIAVSKVCSSLRVLYSGYLNPAQNSYFRQKIHSHCQKYWEGLNNIEKLEKIKIMGTDHKKLS